MIGDLVTVALSGKNGSIDWYCLPHIDSPSVFASILDIDKGGRFQIEPGSSYRSRQNYIKHTNVLQTTFKTLTGTVTITDFMPVKHVARPFENTFPTLIRKVECIRGHMDLKINFSPAFDYARGTTSLKPERDGIKAEQNGNFLFLKSPVRLKINKKSARETHRIKSGETLWFVLQYNDDRDLKPENSANILSTTIAFWQSWVNDSDVYQIETGLFKSPWKEIIIRSGLVLKLLIQDMTGSICAAATTSLPESIGNGRNWDYRFNWIRDASFTIRALYKLGYVNEARKNLQWFMRIATENLDPKDIQVMYGLQGETDLTEIELTHLSGYMNSKPVRIGNGAAKQKQLDIYGELVNVFYETSRFGMDITDHEWRLLGKIIDHVCSVWNEKDAGIWEVRGGYQHFVHSKIMCWVAIDRGLKIANKQCKDCPHDKWEKTREQIKKDILKNGFNKQLNSFTQSYGSKNLDATALLIPIYKFLPFDDPRVRGTIKAIIDNLTTSDGLVYRYNTAETNDGLKGDEGAFLICTFWLIDVLAYSGQIDSAKEIFLKIIDYASPTGLLSEEIDPTTGLQLGNYPQAYSHIGLINSALYIEKAQRKGLKSLQSLEMKMIKKKLNNLINETRARKRAKNF